MNIPTTCEHFLQCFISWEESQGLKAFFLFFFCASLNRPNRHYVRRSVSENSLLLSFLMFMIRLFQKDDPLKLILSKMNFKNSELVNIFFFQRNLKYLVNYDILDDPRYWKMQLRRLRRVPFEIQLRLLRNTAQ